MSTKRHTPEQIINKLRQVAVEIANGATDHTYYRWQSEYGGMRVNQAKRLNELEKENTQLKKSVADQALDISGLKEAVPDYS